MCETNATNPVVVLVWTATIVSIGALLCMGWYMRGYVHGSKEARGER